MISYPRLIIAAVMLLTLCSVKVLSQEDEETPSQPEDEAYKDCPGFPGMPNYVIIDATDKEFDAYSFFDGKKIVSVEGKFCRRLYQLKEGATQASELQVRRNYVNAIKNAGGKVLHEGQIDAFEDTRSAGTLVWGLMKKTTAELWIEISPLHDGSEYWLTTIEKEAMKQDIKASDILTALNTEGHIALYINFDVNKATIKPDSKPIIEQIISLLKENPSLNISIEGHTDNTGNPKKNQTLSEERAKSVRDAIAAEGVEVKRLSTVGWGQDKPIADNTTEEGKAKNRRVELVKK